MAEARDWKKLYQQYRGQWVAIDDDLMTAIAHGESRREVKEAAVQQGKPNALLLKFPDELTAFAGAIAA
jgi:Family of unknown function (DUF5678)